MSLWNRSLRVLAALLIAVPLGQGGLCCCLFGMPETVLETAAAEPEHGCCASAAAPVESADSSCPADQHDGECGCPVRDVSLLAAGSGAPLLLAQASTLEASVVPTEAGVRVLATSVDLASHHPHPPPKQPLYRTLSTLRC